MKVKEQYKNTKIFLQKLRITIDCNFIPEKYMPIILSTHPHIFEEEVKVSKKRKKNDISIDNTIESDLPNTTEDN